MILVLSGTRDGRDIVKQLSELGHDIMASTVTKYGRELIEQGQCATVVDGGLDANGLIDLIKIYGIRLVVDATHPFAVRVSRMAIDICKQLKVPYVRYEREQTQIPGEVNGIIRVDDFEEAARQAQNFAGNIFLTIGSNNLEIFCHVIPVERLIARVLPSVKVLEKCQSLGLNPGQIIAMQGPFSKELNKALFQQFNAGVIVTKDSGRTGGAEGKIEAAKEIGIPVIMIKRPLLRYPQVVNNMEELQEFIMVLL